MNIGENKYYTNIKSYLDDCYFDIATPLSGSKMILDEAQLARMLTRIVVSAATIATTALSLKQYIKDMRSNNLR